MSKVGRIANCSGCGQEKSITFGWFDGPSQQEANFCQECYEHSYEPIGCEVCGPGVVRNNLAKHKFGYAWRLTELKIWYKIDGPSNVRPYWNSLAPPAFFDYVYTDQIIKY